MPCYLSSSHPFPKPAAYKKDAEAALKAGLDARYRMHYHTTYQGKLTSHRLVSALPSQNFWLLICEKGPVPGGGPSVPTGIGGMPKGPWGLGRTNPVSVY